MVATSWVSLLIVGVVLAVVAHLVPMSGTVGRLVNAAAIICVAIGLVLLILSLVGAVA